MNKILPVLFNDALGCAKKVVFEYGKFLAQESQEITLVRDMRGRIRVVLKSRPANSEQFSAFETSLAERLGKYGLGQGRAVLLEGDIGEFDAIKGERQSIQSHEGCGIFLLDRQIIGQDWMRGSVQRTTNNPRVTFYGIKGGVGRSTALVNWAWHLAQKGKKVLIFDLDLESPGVSSSLLPNTHLPDYGIVDWFVEEGVGQAEFIQSEMLGISPLAQGLSGDIKVVSAYGAETGAYMPKLARCYAETSGAGLKSWAERLEKMVEYFEQKEKPDVVIFDSRAGLHDIAAVLATRMGAEILLFAVDTPQTWKGYSLLFEHWQKHPNKKIFRERLHIIAGMVPETGRNDYLLGSRERAWNLFRDYLYDEVAPNDMDAFSYDVNDDNAPHWPVPIFWHRALQEFNPVEGGIDAKTAADALGTFFEHADQWLVMSEQGE